MKLVSEIHGFLWNSMTVNNCNTYLIDGPARILIDPGHLRLFDHVEIGLKQLGLEIDDIDLVLATHAHPDHIEAVKLFKDRHVPFAIHEKDWLLIQEMGAYLGTDLDIESYVPDFFLQEGALEVRGLQFQVIHTPGHSPGSISLYWPARKALVTGDLIFKEGLGRTDLPGGDGRTLKASIKKLADLDAEWVLPGHGDFLSGADQVRNNFAVLEQVWFGYL